MKRFLCLAAVCLLCLPLAGCTKAVKLPYTPVELGMNMNKAQELEPDATAQYSDRAPVPIITILRKERCELGGTVGMLSIGARTVSERETVAGQINWSCTFLSDEVAVSDVLTSSHNSATPGDDARALYQQLMDGVTSSLGKKPNQVEGEDPGDGSAYWLTSYWNIGDNILVICRLTFKPDYVSWSESYTVESSAWYTK